jgi:hypothetical protein
MPKKAHPLALSKIKYARHKAQSKYRNIDFNFSFEEWHQWWLNHGIDKNIDVKWDDGYRPCMCRYEDNGAYEYSNVYFGTNLENLSHRYSPTSKDKNFESERMKKKTIDQTFPDIVGDVRYHSQRMWDRIDQSAGPDACWTWHGPKHVQGYGMVGGVRLATDKRIMQTVHRLLLKIKLNRDIAGNDAVHTCGNQKCVNPAHLFEGTAKDILEIRRANGRDILGKRKGCVSTKPRNGNDYRYGIEAIMSVKRRELNPEQFAVKYNVDLVTARRTVYHMRDKGNYKWAEMMINKEKEQQ